MPSNEDLDNKRIEDRLARLVAPAVEDVTVVAEDLRAALKEAATSRAALKKADKDFYEVRQQEMDRYVDRIKQATENYEALFVKAGQRMEAVTIAAERRANESEWKSMVLAGFVGVLLGFGGGLYVRGSTRAEDPPAATVEPVEDAPQLAEKVDERPQRSGHESTFNRAHSKR